MPSATSITKPLVRPIALCPYCDHVNPDGSKFCAECGAALHLMPCPHCGAVNDITATSVCYRCHGDLKENASVVLPPPPVAAPEPEPDQKKATDTEKPARQRPHALVVGIVLIAFAAASYYAYRQRSVLGVREPAPAETTSGPAPATPNVKAGTILKSKADATTTGAANGATKEVVPANPNSSVTPIVDVKAAVKPEGRASGGTADLRAIGGRAIVDPAPAVVAPSGTESARARAEAQKGLDQQTPKIGNCTDAIAALGLCTPEPVTRR